MSSEHQAAVRSMPERAAVPVGGAAEREGVRPVVLAGQPVTPVMLAALQRQIGNQQVLGLLAARRPPQTAASVTSPNGRVQRLISQADFSDKMASAGATKTGSGVIFDLVAAVRGFHTESAKAGKADKKVLEGHLTTIVEKCEKWLTLLPKLPKTPPEPDRKKGVAITDLLKEARAEQAALNPALAPVAAVVVPLPARGTKIQDRLAFMLAKSRQSTVKAEKEAEPLIEAAQRELNRVIKKQGFQMKADALRTAEEYDKAKVQQGKADAIALASGDFALTALLGKLFKLFQFVPVSFGGTTTLDPQAQMQGFAQKAKELLLALKIMGKTGKEHTGFNDVELVVAGSSAMGYSPHKEGQPAFSDKSDIDLGVVSPKLLAACQDWGATMRGLQDRTSPDPLPAIDGVSRELEKLVPFVKADGKTAKRKVSIMVYASRDVAQRGVGVQI